MPKVKLRAPAGADEANFGQERYRVDNDGTVEVPEEAVSDLVRVGGFHEIAPPADPAPLGMVHMRHEEAGVCCGFGGHEYQADQSGLVTVPAEAADALAAHGFVLVEHVPAETE